MQNTQPSGAYNFYDWKTYEDKENQNLMNIYRNAGRFGNQLTDFSSPFYQQYASYINKATPGIGTNAFLAPLMSSGGNYAGGMSQALTLRGNAMKQRQDTINTGLQGFSSQMMGMLPQLLQIQAGVGGNILNARTQKEISGDQQGGMFDFLSAPLAMFGAQGLAGLFGGMGGASAMIPIAAMASDIRLKENIFYTDEKTKDGIPIVEFNFKNNNQRCRGVIAQDVEMIRPDAVTEIEGIKYVYYGSL